MDVKKIYSKAVEAVEKEKNLEDKMMTMCKVLEKEVEHYDWVGFYLTDDKGDGLVLGPYVGDATDHTHIKFGEGICGQAAEREATFVIQDVSLESNYLSCSPHVKSEIVVPIMRGEDVLGEIDIDSHKKNPFTDADSELLENLADYFSQLI